MATEDEDYTRAILTKALAVVAERTGVTFTKGGQEMFYYPLLEEKEHGRELNQEQIQNSISLIAKSVGQAPPHFVEPKKKPLEQPYSAVDIIRGFFSTFCSIPPFCDPPEKVKK